MLGGVARAARMLRRRRTGAAEVGRCRCGAALLPAALALAGLPRAAGWSHAYIWQPGALAQGGDVKADEMTLAAAQDMCNAADECCGLTFKGADKVPAAPVKIFLSAAPLPPSPQPG